MFKSSRGVAGMAGSNFSWTSITRSELADGRRRTGFALSLLSGGTDDAKTGQPTATGGEHMPNVVIAIADHAVKIGSGVTPSGGAASYLDDGIPLLRSQNVHSDGLRLDDVAYIAEDTHEEMSGTTNVNSFDPKTRKSRAAVPAIRQLSYL